MSNHPLPTTSKYESPVSMACYHEHGPNHSGLTGLRVLMVDDTEINLIIGEKILEDMGLLVETARNGLEAVNMFTASAPGYYDFILTDIRMPVMNGLEEARQIRAMSRPDAVKIPIICATADDSVEDLDDSLLSGVDVKLVKPILAEKLFDTISGLFKKAAADIV